MPELLQSPAVTTTGTPLLTIAIPTFNRAEMLLELLEALAPQIRQHPDVELLVSDNASTDRTPEVVQHFAQRTGLPVRSHRHLENVGSDQNFIWCFEEARGRYLWICGDDDIPVPPETAEGVVAPGALDQLLPHLRSAEFDMVYATSYAFRQSWRAERRHDPLRRSFHVMRSARQFARTVNIMFTFISGIIVHRERVLALRADDPATVLPQDLLGTNLPQLAWTLPLLRHHRQSLVLWDRPLAARQGQAHGYSLGDVFGPQLLAAARRCLPDRPELVEPITRVTVRKWLPSTLLDLRSAGSASAAAMLAGAGALRAAYGSTPSFWIFAWPVLRLPLPLARSWHRLSSPVARLLHLLENPGLLRHQVGPEPPAEATAAAAATMGRLSEATSRHG